MNTTAAELSYDVKLVRKRRETFSAGALPMGTLRIAPGEYKLGVLFGSPITHERAGAVAVIGTEVDAQPR